jgi:hypothetical protein
MTEGWDTESLVWLIWLARSGDGDDASHTEIWLGWLLWSTAQLAYAGIELDQELKHRKEKDINKPPNVRGPFLIKKIIQFSCNL